VTPAPARPCDLDLPTLDRILRPARPNATQRSAPPPDFRWTGTVRRRPAHCHGGTQATLTTPALRNLRGQAAGLNPQPWLQLAFGEQQRFASQDGLISAGESGTGIDTELLGQHTAAIVKHG
jgi:hypothetical protein